MIPESTASADFTGKKLSKSDLSGLANTTTTVSFVNCQSKEWTEIGQLLLTLPALSAVSATECDSGDELCAVICGSRSVVSIQFGNFGVTQSIVKYRTRE